MALLVILAALVLDGSNPAGLHRTWQPGGPGVYVTAWTDPVNLVVVDTTERLYGHASLFDLSTGGPYGIQSGWVQQPGWLYVRLPDGSNPTGHTMHICGPGSGLTVTTPGTVVESVTVRYFGDYGIFVRAPGCTIRNCLTENTGNVGIYLDRAATRSTVSRCTAIEHRIYTWPWSACKGHREEICGIANTGGPYSRVVACTVSGFFDGIRGGIGIQPRAPGSDTVAASYAITDNVIHDVLDDGIEVETVDGRNLLILHNTVQRCTNALSLTPLYVGPAYVLDNRFLDYREGAIKSFGADWDTACSASLYFVGNTCATMANTGAEGNGRLCGYGYFRNNIFYGAYNYIVHDRAPADFDYNLYWTRDARSLIRWNDVGYYDLATWRAATGQEQHGIQLDPLFTGDWVPTLTQYGARP